jgi:hypothetical protein
MTRVNVRRRAITEVARRRRTTPKRIVKAMKRGNVDVQREVTDAHLVITTLMRGSS